MAKIVVGTQNSTDIEIYTGRGSATISHQPRIAANRHPVEHSHAHAGTLLPASDQ
jgi:hypothetical protein